jgi:hypothetical protein
MSKMAKNKNMVINHIKRYKIAKIKNQGITIKDQIHMKDNLAVIGMKDMIEDKDLNLQILFIEN